MAPQHRTIRVDLAPASRSYDVVVGHGVSFEAHTFISAALASPTRVALCTDRGIPAGSMVGAIHLALDRVCPHVHVLPVTASEEAKSSAQSAALSEAFANVGLDRKSAVLAFGGGITGDLVGFTAATYMRGVPWINCPSTLLAMVDASVGGKTGVNLVDASGSLRKNFIGAFHQPRLVLIDTQWLSTLPERQIRCGLAECVKHGLLCRSVPGFTAHDLFDFTDRLLTAGTDLKSDHALAGDLIARNVELKARVVERDEFEAVSEVSGVDAAEGRALLNLGHTYAHVIEGLPTTGAETVLHGEAVALGLVAASHAAHALGRVSPTFVASVERVLGKAGLPTRISAGIMTLPGSSVLIDRMRADKKSLAGRLRLVLPLEPTPGEFGHASVETDPPAHAVVAGWDALRV